MNILPRFTQPASQTNGVQNILDGLIRSEAIEGGKLFGKVPKGHNRQFFCLDEHTWVWHEAWSDKDGNHSLTTRYEIRPNGVFKVQNGSSYQGLSVAEAKNLLRAARLYTQRILPSYQNYLSAA